MRKTYTYSLLQYHHSIVLGEVLNIGLILYFPLTNQIQFIHPNDLFRLRNLYKDFPEKTILTYYEYFHHRIKELNENSDRFYEYDLRNSLKDFLEKEFLPADASMLQFGNTGKGILYTDNIKVLIKRLATLYFPLDHIELSNISYNILSDTDGRKKRSKEDWIKPDIKNKIVKIDKDFIFLPNKNELSF